MIESIFNTLNDKKTKIQIIQDILNLVDNEHIKVLRYKIIIKNKTTIAVQKFFKIGIQDFSISRSAVHCTLRTNEFIRVYYYVNSFNSFGFSSLKHDTSPTITLQICFKPTKKDLYDLIFNTKKSLFFAMKNNSELIKYIISKNEK